MALTIRPHTGDSVTTLYNVSFDLGYIDKDHVFVYLDGNVHTSQLSYVWLNTTQIQLTAPVATGTVFYIRRVVPRNSLVNDYEDGAVLDELHLDNSFKQTLMVSEETLDGFYDVDGNLFLRGDVDLDGHNLNNVNKITVTEVEVGGVNLTDQVEASLAHKNSAAASSTLAEQWATKTDGFVDGVSYSAKHYATTGNVAIVANLAADITTVVSNTTVIQTTAGISTDVTTVAGISANVTTVAGIAADVTTVANDGVDIGIVAGNIANVNATGTSIVDVNTVAASIANVNIVAANNTNINTVAAADANVSLIGTSITDVNVVATGIATIQDAATTMTSIQTALLQMATAYTNSQTRYIGAVAFQ
tara:strand:- start:7782 stop:8867 length:1086 start_codon:yes stop_codon:yes gene_type:complete